MPIAVNQVGYFTRGIKQAIFAADDEQAFPWSLIEVQSGNEVASGMTTTGRFDKTSGDTVHIAHFSSFATPGTYKLVINGVSSAAFKIGDDIYRSLKRDAALYFYRNRSGIELKPEYAGASWARPAGHVTDNNVTAFKGDDADGKHWDGCDYTLNAVGGWYDAGDYGKYVVNGGIAVWTLLNLYENMPDAFPDGSLSIPENNNGIPDILDEARWELEFLLAMQVPQGKPFAGMAYHKLHDRVWAGIPVMPPTEYDNNNDFSQPDMGRYVYEPTTAATLNLAAVAAQASRIWKKFDPAFSERCLLVAKRGWGAAQANPDVLCGRVPGAGGGDYGDNTVADEFYWAACELYLTTGENSYHDFLVASPYFKAFPGLDPNNISAMGWANTAALGTISLISGQSDLGDDEFFMLGTQIVATADRYLRTMAEEGYDVPISGSGYVWGSNSYVLNNAIILALAYDFNRHWLYLDRVMNSMDYILGCNALGKSFVSGYGTNALEHPHHRFWGNDPAHGFPPPPPGALAGGPNGNIQDPAMEAARLGDLPIAKRYLDELQSFATNEVAINWNAPLVWVAAYLDHNSS